MADPQNRASVAYAEIDGRRTQLNENGFTMPLRSEDDAKQWSGPVSQYPHFNPRADGKKLIPHKTDVVNTNNNTPKGFAVMQVVHEPGGKGSKFAADLTTGEKHKYSGGEATESLHAPPLSPRTLNNLKPRFDSFK
jgi:hypothetical protein